MLPSLRKESSFRQHQVSEQIAQERPQASQQDRTGCVRGRTHQSIHAQSIPHYDELIHNTCISF